MSEADNDYYNYEGGEDYDGDYETEAKGSRVDSPAPDSSSSATVISTAAEENSSTSNTSTSSADSSSNTSATPSAPRVDGSRVVGTVKRYDLKSCFGFAVLPDGGPDVFIHMKDLGGNVRALREKQVVEFTLVADGSSGKWKGKNVTAPGGGPLQQLHASRLNLDFARRLAANPQIHLGTIKFFHKTHGYGFIVPEGGPSSSSSSTTSSSSSSSTSKGADGDSSSSSSSSSEDVYLHHHDIVSMGAYQIHEGDEVEYQLRQDKKDGKMKATNVTMPGGIPFGLPVGSVPGAGAGMGMGMGMGPAGARAAPLAHGHGGSHGGMPAGGMGRTAGPSSAQSAASSFDRTEGSRGKLDMTVRTGKVKFFNAAKGYGYVSSLWEGTPTDWLISAQSLERSGIASLEPGQELEFITEIKPDGKLRALGITLASSSSSSSSSSSANGPASSGLGARGHAGLGHHRAPPGAPHQHAQQQQQQQQQQHQQQQLAASAPPPGVPPGAAMSLMYNPYYGFPGLAPGYAYAGFPPYGMYAAAPGTVSAAGMMPGAVPSTTVASSGRPGVMPSGIAYPGMPAMHMPPAHAAAMLQQQQQQQYQQQQQHAHYSSTVGLDLHGNRKRKAEEQDSAHSKVMRPVGAPAAPIPPHVHSHMPPQHQVQHQQQQQAPQQQQQGPAVASFADPFAAVGYSYPAYPYGAYPPQPQ